jgi:hypothetical protein
MQIKKLDIWINTFWNDIASDKKYNSCSATEEAYDESEHIYTKFTEGSVVWARMVGYPWFVQQ